MSGFASAVAGSITMHWYMNPDMGAKDNSLLQLEFDTKALAVQRAREASMKYMKETGNTKLAAEYGSRRQLSEMIGERQRQSLRALRGSVDLANNVDLYDTSQPSPDCSGEGEVRRLRKPELAIG